MRIFVFAALVGAVAVACGRSESVVTAGSAGSCDEYARMVDRCARSGPGESSRVAAQERQWQLALIEQTRGADTGGALMESRCVRLAEALRSNPACAGASAAAAGRAGRVEPVR